MAVLLVTTLTSCQSNAKPPANTAPAAPINTRATIKLVGGESADPATRVCERLARHQSIHAVIQIPEAATPGGPLLDPARVEVTLNGEPLETYLLYRNPTVALVFATALDDRATTPTELTITAALADETDLAAGWRLPLAPTAEQMSRMNVPSTREGRTIRVLDQTGDGVDQARVFGQRREDLLAIANADGRVVLDAPTRSSFETQFAWAPGTWVTRFDAIREPEPVLIPRKGSEKKLSVKLELVGKDGEAITDAWLLVNDSDWVRWKPGKSIRIPTRTDRKNLLNVIAAGYQVKAIEFEKKLTEKTVVMERLAK
jgi:hypothetical protein